MLNQKVAIYVPSTVKGNHPAPAEKIQHWVHEAKILMANLYGGFTAFAGQGGWNSPAHGLIEENVTIVQSQTDKKGLKDSSKVVELAKRIAKDMQQEAVTVVAGGKMNFVAV